MVWAACGENNSQVDLAAGFKNIMKRMGGSERFHLRSKVNGLEYRKGVPYTNK